MNGRSLVVCEELESSKHINCLSLYFMTRLCESTHSLLRLGSKPAHFSAGQSNAEDFIRVPLLTSEARHSSVA